MITSMAITSQNWEFLKTMFLVTWRKPCIKIWLIGIWFFLHFWWLKTFKSLFFFNLKFWISSFGKNYFFSIKKKRLLSNCTFNNILIKPLTVVPIVCFFLKWQKCHQILPPLIWPSSSPQTLKYFGPKIWVWLLQH